METYVDKGRKYREIGVGIPRENTDNEGLTLFGNPAMTTSLPSQFRAGSKKKRFTAASSRL